MSNKFLADDCFYGRYLLVLEAAFTLVELSRHHQGMMMFRGSPVPVSLHLLSLQLKPSLSGLRTPEHPLFTPPPLFGLNIGDATGKQEIEV